MRLIIFIFFLLSCNQTPTPSKEVRKVDIQSDWLLKNETSLNKELNKRIIRYITNNPTDSNWFEKSTVFTKYDSTILGEFSALIDKYSNCLSVKYTYGRDTSKRKTITIFKEDSCNANIDSLILSIDSTKYFTINKREISE